MQTATRVCFNLVPVLGLLAGCQSWHTSRGFTPTQIAALERVGFERIGDGDAMEFDFKDRLLFASGDYTLGPDSRATIERIGHVLVAMQVDIRVDGYTDSEAGESYNRLLSLNRAKAVANVLLSVGIPVQNIHVHGYGKADPVADNHTKDGRRQNRRVAVVVSSE